MINLTELSLDYSNRLVFEDLQLRIFPNEIIGIIGNNGCGKTSLLKIILGAEKNYTGNVEFSDSINISNIFFGCLIESPPLVDYLTVYENLVYKKKFLGLPEIAIEECIQNCKLEKYRNIKVKNLSLGNKQKLGIAQAIIQKPQLLLLDEPTNSIDEDTSQEIIDSLISYQEESKCAIVIVSHDMKVIERICSKIYRIQNFKASQIK